MPIWSMEWGLHNDNNPLQYIVRGSHEIFIGRGCQVELLNCSQEMVESPQSRVNRPVAGKACGRDSHDPTKRHGLYLATLGIGLQI